MPDQGPLVAGVVLAAGEGSRFGGPKQALLLPHVLRRVTEAQLDPVVVVLGAHDVALEGVQVVRCQEWQKGPGASLAAGLAALDDDVGAAVVCLADGPLISPEAIRRVVAAWRDGAGDVIAASYGGARGHPVCIGRAAWHDVPAVGGRAVDAVLVPCDDLGAPEDVDTVDDLRRIERLL
jgi:CTP:molybdopterin cytidylyltransferase MocA